jgi:transcriptional regulator with XRE-family HTH domain
MPDGDVRSAEELARIAEMGAMIRNARQGRFTVHELAARADISPGSLSQIERGIGNPSFRTLHRLASALGLRVGDLVEGTTLPDTKMVVRKLERKRLQLGSEGLTYELLTPDLHRRLEVLQTVVPPGFSNESQPFMHVGEECVLVMTGHLEVTVGTRHFELNEGDAITYDSGEEHWWHNPTDRAAVVVGAVTPPTF